MTEVQKMQNKNYIKFINIGSMKQIFEALTPSYVFIQK